MGKEYITVQLNDYMLVNGKIAPDREVTFNHYDSGTVYVSFHGASHFTSCWGETVTRVRRHPKGYSGTNEKGKRVVVDASNASIKMPLSILKGV